MGLVARFVVRELALLHRQNILRAIPIGGVTNSAAAAHGGIAGKGTCGQGQISCPDAAAFAPGVVIREGTAGDGYFRVAAKAGTAAGCGGVLRKGAALQKQVVCVIVIGTQAAAVGSRMVAAEGHILQG